MYFHEIMYGLPIEKGKDIDERRKAVLNRKDRTHRTSVTPYRIEDLIFQVFGLEASVSEQISKYTFSSVSYTHLKYRSSLSYNATVAEDKEKLWDNKSVQEGLRRKGKHIINALDVIEAVLLPGEKERILEVIDELSGYGSESAQIDTAKN